MRRDLAGFPKLTDLAINTTGNRFPFSGIARLQSLETLRIVGMRFELDCEVFRKLAKLREANVSGSRRIRNVQILSELPSTRFFGFGKDAEH